MRTEAEREARDKSQQFSEAEQQLRRRETALADKLLTTDRKERELPVQAQTIAEREKSDGRRRRKYEQLVAAQQHELERLSA